METLLTNQYIGLLFECPFKEELDNCPFKSLRELAIKERIEKFDNLPTEIITSKIETHINCIGKRENLKVPVNNNYFT